YTHYYTHYYGEETPGDNTPSRLERIWNTVRGRFRGDNRASTAPTVPTEQTNDLPIDMAMDAPVATGTKSRRKYRNVIGGVLLLVGLVALISALAWKAGWFGTALQPREILRKKLDTPAEATPSRDSTAAPPSPPPRRRRPRTAGGGAPPAPPARPAPRREHAVRHSGRVSGHHADDHHVGGDHTGGRHAREPAQVQRGSARRTAASDRDATR